MAAIASAAEAVAHGGALVVNGIVVARFVSSVGKTSPAQRAALAASRLAGAGSAWAEGAYVVVDGNPVYGPSVADAKASKTTPQALAIVWAKKLNAALQIPPLKASDEFVRLPQGSATVVRLTGIEAKTATLKSDDPTIAGVERVNGGIRVRSKRLGRTAIAVQGATTLVTIDVQVRPWAATLPKTLDVEVTGAPATGNVVYGAIEGALKTNLTGNAGVKFNLGPIKSRSIESGTSLAVPVRVKADAPDAYPVNGLVTVRVKNVPLPRLQDQDLWYSNNPESVRQPGPLFSATLRKGTAARLLYHHMNATVNEMFLRVQAINESDVPARVAIIPGDSDPDRNPVKAGLQAANQYVRAWVTGSAELVTVPPHSTLPICLRRLTQYETGSGLCSLRLVDGPDSMLVRTDAFPPFPLDDKWTAALFSSTPWHEVGTVAMTDYDRAPTEASLHIYPDPYKTESVDYEVGGRYGFVRLGQRPIQRQDASGGLDGNFGVIYTIKARLENPTSAPHNVEIVFEASAGYASGLFVVNGRTVTLPQLAPKTEGKVMQVHLAPGQVQMFDIMTLPLSGSAYPATLTIRPVTQESR